MKDIKSMREFEIRTIVYDRFDRPRMLVYMDLETYNEALACYMDHMRNDCFNDGFRVGNNYPSEEEIADMDADRTENDS